MGAEIGIRGSWSGFYATLSPIYLNLMLTPIALGSPLPPTAFPAATLISLYFNVHAIASRRSERPKYPGESFLLLVMPSILSHPLLRYPQQLRGVTPQLAFGLATITRHYPLLVPLATYHENLEERTKPLLYRPLVSVIIPARNEERVVGHTIRSVLESD